MQVSEASFAVRCMKDCIPQHFQAREGSVHVREDELQVVRSYILAFILVLLFFRRSELLGEPFDLCFELLDLVFQQGSFGRGLLIEGNHLLHCTGLLLCRSLVLLD